MKLGRWVDLRMLLVTMESDLGNIFMIPHEYYFMQVTVASTINTFVLTNP